MLKNHFRDRIDGGQPAFGFYLSFPSAELAEFMGYVGFDYVLIDAEHYVFDRETIQSIARSANLTEMTPLARVPKNDQELILGYLEAGVLGVVVPHIDSAEAARMAVNAVKYFPLGQRGAGSGTRPANYGLTQTSAEYFAEANRQTIVLALVEDEAGIRNLPEILSVDGLDGVSIGSGDLALSMGYPGQPGHPDVQKLVGQARSQIMESSKLLGVMESSGEGARQAAANGAGYVTVSLTGMLAESARGFLKAANEGSATS